MKRPQITQMTRNVKRPQITQIYLILSCMVGVNVSAHDIAVPNADGVTIYYNYINNDTELAVTFGEDENTNYKYSGDVVIPEEVILEERTLKVTQIEHFTFSGCYELTSVTIPNSVTSIGDFAFAHCSGLTSIDIGNGVTTIGSYVFWECTNLDAVTMGNSVTSIGDFAFYGCSSLKSITIPPSVTHIGHDVFRNCNDLNAVHISDLEAWCNIQFDDEPFGYYHLYLNGKEIKDLTIPEGVTSVGNYAFANCYRLLSITIPDGVTSIGGHAFEWCSNLQNIYCHAGQVPETGNNVFGSSIVNATLHVPAASVSAYQAVEPWKNFKEIVALPEPEDDYRPFVEEDKVWTIKVIANGWPTTEEWTEFYYLKGDTIVNGHNAKRMLCDRVYATESENTYRKYVGACYEQDKKVYYSFYNGGIQFDFELLYDFTLSTGDIITMPDGTTMIVNKLSGGIPGFKGTYYDFGVKEERWLEGVGSESWPWNNHPRWANGNIGILFTCSVGDEVIYYNSEVVFPYIMEAQKRRFDFTHTIKTQPKAPIKRVKSDAGISSYEREVARPNVKAPRRSETELSIFGEYNDMQLSIHLDPLDDAYMTRITDETGKVVYKKTVNAGNIVGLNIDISAYPKGCYRVTVENSSETFTGEFEAQTTGIEEVRSKKPEVNDAIYNLQGQRIHSLQKGLNIVNGQKVFVKVCSIN